MRIKRYNETVEDTNSNNKDKWKLLQNKVISDTNLNLHLIGTFGFGMGFFYPIVSNLVKNMNLDVEVTDEMIVMLTICVFCVIFKDKKENIKKLVEGIRLNGTFNLLKPILKCINIFKDIFKIIYNSCGVVTKNITEIFSYATMFIPICNLLSDYIKHEKINLDTIQNNLLTIGMGIITITGKHIISQLIDAISKKITISKEKIMSFFKVKNDKVKKFSEFKDDEMIVDNYYSDDLSLLEECTK